MVIGPALAAGLVVATYFLTREIAEAAAQETGTDARTGGAPWGATPESVARFAAAVSVVCVALRYHTADTMAHGASALGIALALTAALRGARLRRPALFAWAGLAVGYVAMTRPVSAIPSRAPSRSSALRAGALGRGRRAGFAAVGMVPGLLFFAFACARVG